MTVLDRPARTARGGVVAEIARRRRDDVAAELAGLARGELRRRLAQAPPPRPIAEQLAAPGLHLVAEVKRASPSAGQIATPGEDLVARARAYEAGGAAAISVLCEPHWFGGSIADLAAVRRAVTLPVLAKEFVVDPRQLELLRAAGADLVLLLAVLHPPRRLRRLVEQAVEIGLEPLVEAHEEREIEAVLSTPARLVGINNRDLRSLAVDVAVAGRLRERIPDDRIAIAESGVRDPATIREWRAAGYDAALVGEALVRAADPVAAARSFVAAGRPPDDPANRDRAPFVKICGLTDAAGVLAAVRAGADAIGLNLVPGTPRALALHEAADLAAVARAAAPAGRAPTVVAVTVDRDAAELNAVAAAIGADVVQLNGDEAAGRAADLDRPAWKVLHLRPAEHNADSAGTGSGPDAASAELVGRARLHLSAGVSRLMLDASAAGQRGGTGRRADAELAAAVAREVPVILAGGLHAGNVAQALHAIPAVGVDVASGVEAPRTGVPGDRPRKDPFRVALFVKRARAARSDRPAIPARPTPVHPGLLDADDRGRWGVDREFGGRFVPETLMAALVQLEQAYAAVRHEPRFWAELRELLAHYAGRPTPLYRADRLAELTLAEAREEGPAAGVLPERLRLYLKREDLAHTGAHKINNALGQVLLARRLGKTRVIAETGAGQHGVATATACALLGIPCVVYMGAEDIRRQQPNVLRMEALEAQVRPVTSGSATLKDAVNEAMRDWVTNVASTHYVLGSAMGPHPYPTIVRDLQRTIGDEAAVQLREVEGRLPDLVLACVGGGSNAIGLLQRFIGESAVRLAISEAAGDGLATGHHAAALAGGTPGILHGARSMMLQDADGQVVEAHSASAGLDYPGVGPQIAALVAAGRVELAAAADAEAFAAMAALTRLEGILPALESAHAIAALPGLLAGSGEVARRGVSPRGTTDGRQRSRPPRPWPAEAIVLLGLSGRGDKDLAAFGTWRATPATAGETIT